MGTKRISLEIHEWDAAKFEQIVGDAVVRRIEGKFEDVAEYDEDEDDFFEGQTYTGGDLSKLARETIERRVDAALGDMLKARLHDHIEAAIRRAFEEGVQVRNYNGGRDTETVGDQVRKLLEGRHFVAPREMKRGNDSALTLVEYIAYTSANGVIEQEAKRLVEDMKGMLQQQIASNLGEQLATRMLKGAG